MVVIIWAHPHHYPTVILWLLATAIATVGRREAGAGLLGHCLLLPSSFPPHSLPVSTSISLCEQWLAGWEVVLCLGGSHWGAGGWMMRSSKQKPKKKKKVS